MHIHFLPTYLGGTFSPLLDIPERNFFPRWGGARAPSTPSPWAETPNFRISYHLGGQMLLYIFGNLTPSALIFGMIAVINSRLS